MSSDTSNARGATPRTSFVTSRPVAVVMLFLAAVVFGLFSYRRLPVTLMPELSYPTLTVRTEYPGAAPEEVENDISRPVEETLGVIGGLRRLSSVSRAGVSDVILEFSWDTKMTDAIQDTLEKLDLVFLPDEAERPLILRFDPSLDPVMELSMSGEGARFSGDEGLRRLRRVAELQVKRALEPIKGVAAARVRGGLEEEIHVQLDDGELRRARVSVQNVIDRLRQENINVAGGTLTEGRTEYMVRTLNEYQDLGEIADTIITQREGRQIRIRDLGQVVWANKERQITTRTDGNTSVQIEIFKEADANIVALAHRVKERLGEFDPDAEQTEETPSGAPTRGDPSGLAEELYLNEGIQIKVVADRSVFIEGSINEVRNTAIIGGLLAVVVLFLFLRSVISTLIIAVSIPISLFITFAPLNMLSVSLNIMSLGGLALGIGMLVDSSIVVLESIFRCREEGDGIVDAAIRGTAEVRMAVIASTLTSIAVFLPMVFVEGVAGQAFGDLGLAVVISLLAALLVAVAFIPMLASLRGINLEQQPDSLPSLLPTSTAKAVFKDAQVFFTGWFRGARLAIGILLLPLVAAYLLIRLILGTVFELIGKLLLIVMAGLGWFIKKAAGPAIVFVFSWGTGALLRVTEAVLDWLGRHYPKVIRWGLAHPAVVAILAFASMAMTVGLFMSLDSELLPEVHQGEFTIEATLPVGTPLEETEAILAPVETAILSEREHIDSLLLTLGFDPTTSQRSDEGEHTARFKIILDTSNPKIEEQVINRLRAKLRDIPDLESRVVRPVLFSFRTPIEVEVHGEDLIALRQMAERVRSLMTSMPQLADVETTQRTGAPEVQIQYDRDQLSRYGLNIANVASQVRDAVKGFEATLYNLGDRRIPIVVRFNEADRSNVAQVGDFMVNPGAERPIPLSAVAEILLAEGPSEVRRIDGRRVALVNANLATGSLGAAVEAIEKELHSQIEWPSDMTFYISGQNQEWQRSQASLLLALALSVFLVYVIMAAQFESLIQPLIIMLTIPLAFFGTVVALLALGINVSIVVFLGMIMLAGIVVNNAIVLVDYINTLRERGMERAEAIVTAGSVRLRPILMTTATTVLGLLPMALGLGDGAEIRTPMAIAVISGLLASTVLTLIVIPSFYSILDRGRERLLGAPKAAPVEEGAES
ncbi:MAG: efflux RND transporter permease subunit [bacterium]|nr:efflux RND transporter permease subunit [bacterium]